nr:uncharacterized protein LOC111984809 [Quercus suber]POE86037.1 hypothetical protein CFP56_02406 [Quercus suber]
MDLDLIQIHPRFEASKYLDFKASHVLLQGNALFYVLKLKPPSFPGGQVPSHQTWFIPCHISIRYITIGKHPSSIHKWRHGAKFDNGELPSNQILVHYKFL